MPVSVIVVETGSGTNPAANSYVDLATVTQYALDRGIVFPTGDAGTTKLFQAMDYLRQFDYYWLGDKAVEGQPLAWPRAGVKVDGSYLPEDEIPQALIDAQSQLSIEAMSGPLVPSRAGSAKFITREKVGPIETEYSSAVNSSGLPYFPLVDNLLSQLLGPGAMGQGVIFRRA